MTPKSPPYKKIRLSGPNGKGTSTLVSTEDYPNLAQYSWNIHARGHVYGWYPVEEDGKRKKVLIQRVIMGVLSDPGLKVLHKNGNKLDNRRENLIVVTHAVNVASRSSFRRSKYSNFRGVTFNTSRQQWEIRQIINGEEFKLGFYDTEEEAARKVAAFRVSRLENPHIDDIELSKGVEPPTPVSRYTKIRQLPASGHEGITKSGDKWRVEVDGVFCGRYSTLSEAIKAHQGGPIEYYEREMVKNECLEPEIEVESAQKAENRLFEALDDGYAQKELEKAQKRAERAQKAENKRIQALEAAERAKEIKKAVQSLKRIKKRANTVSPKLKRARKQYEANKIRKANGMEPLPLVINWNKMVE